LDIIGAANGSRARVRAASRGRVGPGMSIRGSA
jgi:hypothetical protein